MSRITKGSTNGRFYKRGPNFRKFDRSSKMVKNGLTCQTPTMALAIKMSRITKGSTNAVIDPSSSSKNASTKEITAASNKILTRRSSNCSNTRVKRDLPSSAGNSEKSKKL